jgi:putative lipoic acid-binding regulatory protein
MKKDFEGLYKELQHISFPNLYLFKFIMKADVEKIAQLESLFDSKRAQIRRKSSAKGSYISISVKEIMLCPEEIIHVYDKSSKINGVIAL